VDYRDIRYEPGTVARIVLNRPQYFNALNFRLMEELDDAFRRADASDDVAVVVLSGEGRHFSAGHDIGSKEQVAETAERGGRRTPGGRTVFAVQPTSYRKDTFINWHRLAKPTIAMVHGYCIFAGYALASSMDLVFAASDALFLPEMIFWPPLTTDVAARKAKEILFEHRFFTAEEGREQGFVSRVYPRAHLEAQTLAYAQRVAANPRAMTAKRLVNRMLDSPGFLDQVHALQAVQATRRTAPAARADAGRRRGPAEADVALRNLHASMDWAKDVAAVPRAGGTAERATKGAAAASAARDPAGAKDARAAKVARATKGAAKDVAGDGTARRARATRPDAAGRRRTRGDA
jgi:enoyl-CoA hydratase